MKKLTKSDPIRPRWSKVLSDLWGDKTRTGLVVVSIAVGVFAIGVIITAFVILSEDVNASYASVNPVNINIWTDPFTEDLVRRIEKLPGVEQVEGRRILPIRARRDNENWQSLFLVGVDQLENIKINRLDLLQGVSSPGRDEVVISQDMINNTGFHASDLIEIELPDNSTHLLKVVGVVKDQSTTRPDSSGANAFVSLETLDSLGLGSDLNRLLVVVEGDGGDEAKIAEIAALVEDKVERNNLLVYRTEEALSNTHPMSETLLAILGVLGMLGILITILSASLIINTLNALLAQQLRQIGVMKLIGGRSVQILGMYLGLIVAYSVIALFLAVPLGALAGYKLADFVSSLLGAELQGFRIVPAAIVTQVLIAFLVPLGAGFFPVNRGARTNVQQAISNYHAERRSTGRSHFHWGSRWLGPISRPILLAFRNTFRKKGRLVLTIFTLTIAGAVFIAVFNVRASMNNVMDQLMQHFMGDVTINFNQPYKIGKVKRDLLAVPGVIGVEGWGGASAEILDPNGDPVTGLSLVAPPQDTQLLDLDFVAGRGLAPGEKKALVVADTIYIYYPHLQPGDKLMVEVEGNREELWEVVGIFRFVNLFGEPMAYADYAYLSTKAGLHNQATSYRIITDQHDNTSLEALIGRIDRQLAERGYAVQSIEAGYVLRESTAVGVNTLIAFLLIMALLTAIVGGIGLTGTMSINVLERTREIGVMRTIGAVDFVIMKSVIIEALVIGLITWILAIGLSFPTSSALLTIMGQTMTASAIEAVFTPLGLFLWLGIVIVLSIIASLVPARNAARLTINEVLAYE